MRKIILAANWKMNKIYYEVEDFLNEYCDFVDDTFLNNLEIIIAPPAVFLEFAKDIVYDSQIFISAQNVGEFDSGAYTGEISAEMIKSLEINYCIIGHSERRKYFNDTNESVNRKLAQLLKNEISPIICIGETLKERESNKTKEVILEQLENTFQNIDLKNKNLVIAYEPVWAIGTGKNATPEQAQEIHEFIRNWMSKNLSPKIAENTPILYGGSVNPGNIEQLIKQPDIDGGLVGGASLVPEKFISMTNIILDINR